VEGQIHGGLAQGIGQAMIEEASTTATVSSSRVRSWTTRCRVRSTSPFRAAQHGDTDAGQSTGRQRRRRSRHARLNAEHRLRGVDA
jgi:hypothetical protein